MGKKSRRDAQQREEAKNTLTAANAAEAKAARRTLSAHKAEQARNSLTTGSDPGTEAAGEVVPVVTPAAGAVDRHEAEPRVNKPKRARFVRENKESTEKLPPAELAPPPRRTTTAAGRMMSKNVLLPPKEERSSGPRGQAFGPKPRG